MIFHFPELVALNVRHRQIDIRPTPGAATQQAAHLCCDSLELGRQLACRRGIVRHFGHGRVGLAAARRRLEAAFDVHLLDLLCHRSSALLKSSRFDFLSLYLSIAKWGKLCKRPPTCANMPNSKATTNFRSQYDNR